MIQTKIFEIPKDAASFNLFVKDHPPTTTNGLKILPEYVILTYENGEVAGKGEKIRHLLSELNTLITNELEEARQYKDAVKMSQNIPENVKTHDRAKIFDNLLPMRNNVLLTHMKMEVIVDELLQLGKTDIVITYSTLPPVPEYGVKSDIMDKKK